MTTDRQFDDKITRWLEETAPARLNERVLETTFERTRRTSQQVGWRALLRPSQLPRLVVAFGSAAAVVVAIVLALSFFVKQPSVVAPPTQSPTTSVTPTPSAVPSESLTPTPEPSSNVGIFDVVAGRIVYGNRSGIWGVDPALADPTTQIQLDPSTRVQLTSEMGTPLGWSSDGTRLLIQKGYENLFVMDADGSETQVTDQLSGNSVLPGSSRPTGATISAQQSDL